MAKTLRLKFTTGAGDNWSMSLRYPKDGITLAEATAAGQAVIDSAIFLKNPQAFVGAEIIDRTVTEIEA